MTGRLEYHENGLKYGYKKSTFSAATIGSVEKKAIA
jgi:hypothetical protein